MQSKSDINTPHEIDITEIWNATVKYWKLISIITTISALIAILYLSVAPKAYKSKAILTSANLSELNKLNNGLKLLDLGQDKAFQELYRIITQSDLQLNFFKENIYSTMEETIPLSLAFKDFQSRLNIINTSKKNTFKSIELTYTSPNPDLSSDILKQYINEANEKLNNVYLQNYKAKLTSSKRQIQRLINELTNTANQDTEVEIYQLKEAINIAKSLKIATPTSNSSFNNLVLDSSINSQSIPLYSLGYQALELRVKSLENRKNNGLFIEGYSSLKAQLDALNSIELPNHKLTLFSYEHTPMSISDPIKPKPKLIMLLAILLGLIVGTLTAIIKYLNDLKSTTRQSTQYPLNKYNQMIKPITQQTTNNTELQN